MTQLFAEIRSSTFIWLNISRSIWLSIVLVSHPYI